MKSQRGWIGILFHSCIRPSVDQYFFYRDKNFHLMLLILILNPRRVRIGKKPYFLICNIEMQEIRKNTIVEASDLVDVIRKAKDETGIEGNMNSDNGLTITVSITLSSPLPPFSFPACLPIAMKAASAGM